MLPQLWPKAETVGCTVPRWTGERRIRGRSVVLRNKDGAGGLSSERLRTLPRSGDRPVTLRQHKSHRDQPGMAADLAFDDDLMVGDAGSLGEAVESGPPTPQLLPALRGLFALAFRGGNRLLYREIVLICQRFFSATEVGCQTWGAKRLLSMKATRERWLRSDGGRTNTLHDSGPAE